MARFFTVRYPGESGSGDLYKTTDETTADALRAALLAQGHSVHLQVRDLGTDPAAAPAHEKEG